MQCRLKCENPGEIEYSLTITMKVVDWDTLRDQLMSRWPSGKLVEQINDLLSQARKVYWAEDDE